MWKIRKITGFIFRICAIYFKQIRELAVDIRNKNIDNVSMSALSMGMTGDYTVAIEEGATLVRVGTGIFGERNYNKE